MSPPGKVLLVKMIKEITLQFAKYHYDEYLKKEKIEKIEDRDIEEAIKTMWTHQRKKELGEIIRENMKKFLKEDYSTFIIEGIISEMFMDDNLAIGRIQTEIKAYQQNK